MSAQSLQRPRRALLVAGVLMTMLSVPAVVPALASAAPVTTTGSSPLELTVHDAGNVQVGFPGVTDFKLFYQSGTEVGGAQFFLGFPVPVRTDTSDAVAGPDLGDGRADFLYTPVTAPALTGTGTAGDPYRVTTGYRVDGSAAEHLLEITQVVTYTNGAKQFSVSYAVKNVSGAAIRYRASTGADLFESEDGAEVGFGFFDGGPPLVGGQRNDTGRWAGIEQASPAWAHHQTALWSTIWAKIGNSAQSGFDDTVNDGAANIDHGTGVQWDDHYGAGAGLANNATATYSLVWKTDVKAASSPRLTINPSTASQTVGQSHAVSMSAFGRSDWALSNKTVRYEVKGANPSLGSVTTNAFGIANESLSGANSGEDAITAFVDLDGDTIKDAGEPLGSAGVTWTAAPTGSTPPPAVVPKGPSTAVAPPPDSDADGVSDTGDGCPTVTAATADGCPPGAGPALAGATSVIRSAFKRLGIRRLFQQGAASFVFRAPSAGTLTVTGTAGVRGGFASKKLVLLAGKRAFQQAGTGKVKLKLTKKGKRSIKRAKKATIALTMVFKNRAGRVFNKTIKVTVKRR